MAVPKKKVTSTRRDKRRANDSTASPALATCSHCGHIVIPHRVCDNCGFYAGLEVVEPED